MRRTLVLLGALAVAAPAAGQGGALAEAQALFDRNRLDEALPLAREAAASGPDARVLLADVLRRLGQRTDDPVRLAEAVAVARSVTESAGCSAPAWTVLGDAYNPQFSSWPRAHADSTWDALREAVACDPDDGNAWLSFWTEADRRGDAIASDHALRELARVGFWTPPVRAYARWTLTAAPPDAVLLTNGDADTVPMRMLQAVGGLRTDVVVVNVPMLALPEVARRLAEVHALPLPDAVEAFEPRPDPRGSTETPDGRVYTLADYVLDHWLRYLERPLVGALSLDPAVLGTKTDVVDRGATLAPASAPGFDPEAARASFEGVDGGAFAGPVVSDGDRSPVRRAGLFDPGGLVLFQMLQTAVSFAEAGDAEAAETAYVHAVAFAEATGHADDPLVPTAREWIDAALTP